MIDSAEQTRKATAAGVDLTKEVEHLTRSLANIPGVAPIDLWRYRAQGGSRSGVASATGNGVVINELYLTSSAQNAKQLFEDVRREAIRDVRTGGQGLRGAIPA